jgi:hypothetical protein
MIFYRPFHGSVLAQTCGGAMRLRLFALLIFRSQLLKKICTSPILHSINHLAAVSPSKLFCLRSPFRQTGAEQGTCPKNIEQDNSHATNELIKTTVV